MGEEGRAKIVHSIRGGLAVARAINAMGANKAASAITFNQPSKRSVWLGFRNTRKLTAYSPVRLLRLKADIRSQ